MMNTEREEISLVPEIVLKAEQEDGPYLESSIFLEVPPQN